MIDPGTNLRKAVFLDRDGTLMHDVGYCADPTQVQLLEGVTELLPKLKETGFTLVVITNQSGIGRKYFRESDFWKVQEELDRKVGADVINATYVCPDPPDAVSERRKPRPGMLLEAANDLSIDLKQSYMVGDKISDVEAGIHAGVKGTILLEPAPSSEALSSGASLIARNFREAVEFILSK